MNAWRWLRAAIIALLVGVYAWLSHESNTAHIPRSIGAALAAAPLLCLIAGLAWRFLPPAAAIAVFAGLALALFEAWGQLLSHSPAVMLVQQLGMWALLGAGFASSLLPGRIALCTVWADQVHGPLSQKVLRYTRIVTAGWAIFFALVALVSLGLFCFAPLRAWSMFENFWTLPLIAAMFVLEYVIRWFVLPDLRQIGILEAVRLYASHR
jgi:uncharacterized membrane protein